MKNIGRLTVALLVVGAVLGATVVDSAATRAAPRLWFGSPQTGDERERPPAVERTAQRVVKGAITRLLDPADPTAGKLRIGYELHRSTDPATGTILAIEGGPGYSTTASRAYYLDLFKPLIGNRNLLLIDARGTGGSDAIRCRQLQSYRGSYARAVRRCGRQLGSTSDLYGSAFAADDFVGVLDALGIDQVDVYGDSYGTFLGQAFTVRHPDLCRLAWSWAQAWL